MHLHRILFAINMVLTRRMKVELLETVLLVACTGVCPSGHGFGGAAAFGHIHAAIDEDFKGGAQVHNLGASGVVLKGEVETTRADEAVVLAHDVDRGLVSAEGAGLIGGSIEAVPSQGTGEAVIAELG